MLIIPCIQVSGILLFLRAEIKNDYSGHTSRLYLWRFVYVGMVYELGAEVTKYQQMPQKKLFPITSHNTPTWP